MQIIKRSKISIKKEIICWVALVIFLICFNHTQGPPLAYYTYIVFYTFNFAWSYYVLYLLIFPNFFEKNRLFFILSCLLVITTFISVDYLHVKKITPALGGTNISRGDLELIDYIGRALIPFSFVAVASSTSYLNWRSINRLKEETEKEKDLIQKELSFYKTQFNSHFTLNFFNFCYNKTLYSNSEAAKDVERFGEMLHFSLKNNSNEYVTLNDEIEYIANFISIQKCITNKVFFELSYDFNPRDFYIVPGIISTLVENSFKHGIFSDGNHPMKLSLLIYGNSLTATLKNKKTNRKVINSTGIGLNDLIEILETFYPNKYKYVVHETDNEYAAELILELLPVG